MTLGPAGRSGRGYLSEPAAPPADGSGGQAPTGPTESDPLPR